MGTSALLQGLLFTGTDTGVGKTYVTARVARLLKSQGRDVRVSKPVATGATRDESGRWVSDDTLMLARAVDGEGECQEITPWTFPEPAAPPVAARDVGVTLNLKDLADAVRRRNRSGAALLVEGVGGLLCPLTEQETVADLARELRLPLVVVARTALGTLNHTLLTLEVAHGRRLPVVGVVLCETVPGSGLAHITVISELRQRISVPILAVVPHRTTDAIAPELEAVDWWHLCQSAAG